jgi:hypothetical protein
MKRFRKIEVSGSFRKSREKGNQIPEIKKEELKFGS